MSITHKIMFVMGIHKGLTEELLCQLLIKREHDCRSPQIMLTSNSATSDVHIFFLTGSSKTNF